MKKVKVTVCMVLLLLFISCSEYYMPKEENLNRYSYVAMPPIYLFEQQGIAPYQNTVILKDRFSKLFSQAGMNVLSDYGAVDNIPSEEYLRVLYLGFSYSQNNSESTVTLSLYNSVDREVLRSTAKYNMGMDLQDDLLTAAKNCFSRFRDNYSGFDPNLAAAYAKDLQDEFKNWEKKDVDEVILRGYVDKHINILDPIEGIWMLNQPGLSRTRIGILRDDESHERDFVGVSLAKGAILKPGHIIRGFQKTANPGIYIATIYRLNYSKEIVNAVLSDEGSLDFNIVDTNTGKSVTIRYIRIYPHEVTITPAKAEPGITSPESITQGTGFAISSKGHIVTAYHIIQSRKTIKVYLSKESFVSAKVLYGDPVNDLVVLKVESTTPDFLPVAPTRSVKAGDRIFTIGFPVSSILGQEAKYTEGVVSSLSGPIGAASFLQITVPIQPGNSGGPLVNETGEVVGIVTSSAAILPFIKESGTLPQNVNWAVKADYLRPLIELPKVTEQQREREELINHVKNSTFFIETE